jgi:hypothetical protein
MARSIAEIRTAFPYSNDCVELQKTIDKIINEKSFYALKLKTSEIKNLDIRLNELNSFFTKINCEMVLGNKKLEQVSVISEKYQDVDKIRIESENKKAVNNRIYIGVGIVLLGVSIIFITNKK